MRSRIGKIEAVNIPTFRLSEKLDETKPTTDGPALHPKSPPNAKRANIAVEPFGNALVEIENVPGHIIPTLKPQIAHPTREINGIGDSEIIAYETKQRIVHIFMAFVIESLSPNFPYIALAVPIRTANARGPARSPMVLDILSPC